jgi:hypothetical protein
MTKSYALSHRPRLGVVVVTYNSAPVILGNLESLLAALPEVDLDIVVVDNGSTDDTCAKIRAWAAGTEPAPLAALPVSFDACAKPVKIVGPEAGCDENLPAYPVVTLIETGLNAGFAAGVNRGLAHLLPHSADRIWILNPDGIAAPGAALAFATQDSGPFSLMGGRVLYAESPDVIQIDGGVIDWRSGVTGNVNQGASHSATPPPAPSTFDFITGASMVASRSFLERAGPMAEEYFLYYEEVDWALRRGDLPLAYCPDGIVYHWAGTAIGSPKPGRMASPFSLYFKHRGRMMFVRRHLPRRARTTAVLYTMAKAAQIAVSGHFAEAKALLDGACARPPGARIARLLSDEARNRIGWQ